MTTVLSTQNLTKTFGGVHALDQINIGFRAGIITALIGPNGSGKTTFVNVITGLVAIESGTIEINGEQRSTIKPFEVSRLGITRTFQNARLIPQMTVLDNVLVVLTERSVWQALSNRHTKEHLAQAEAVLKRVGLWEKRHEYAENLSYGQRKLLEIARAISMRASVYLFDEPFSGLFPEMVALISSMIRKLKSEGAAIVLVEHDMALVRQLADYAYVLDSGQVIAEGAPNNVLKQRHVIEAYLGT